MLQTDQSALRTELLETVKPNEDLCEQILNMGFDIELIRQALKETTNDMQRAVENLLKMQADGSYSTALQELLQNTSPSQPSSENAVNQPSTSSQIQAIQDLADETQVIPYSIY